MFVCLFICCCFLGRAALKRWVPMTTLHESPGSGYLHYHSTDFEVSNLCNINAVSAQCKHRSKATISRDSCVVSTLFFGFPQNITSTFLSSTPVWAVVGKVWLMSPDYFWHLKFKQVKLLSFYGYISKIHIHPESFNEVLALSVLSSIIWNLVYLLMAYVIIISLLLPHF